MDITLKFDNRVNSIESVQKALYRLGSGIDFDIELVGSSIELRIVFLDLETDSKIIAAEIVVNRVPCIWNLDRIEFHRNDIS